MLSRGGTRTYTPHAGARVLTCVRVRVYVMFHFLYIIYMFNDHKQPGKALHNENAIMANVLESQDASRCSVCEKHLLCITTGSTTGDDS